MKTLIKRAQLIGEPDLAPEIKGTTNGKNVANFSLSAPETYRNKQGEKITDTSK